MMRLPPVRATDCEREDTVEALRTAFAAGCLDSRELAERAGRAYAAVTCEELHTLIRDLPRRPGSAELSDRWGPRHTLGWEFGLMLAGAGRG